MFPSPSPPTPPLSPSLSLTCRYLFPREIQNSINFSKFFPTTLLLNQLKCLWIDRDGIADVKSGFGVREIERLGVGEARRDGRLEKNGGFFNDRLSIMMTCKLMISCWIGIGRRFHVTAARVVGAGNRLIRDFPAPKIMP